MLQKTTAQLWILHVFLHQPSGIDLPATQLNTTESMITSEEILILKEPHKTSHFHQTWNYSQLIIDKNTP